MKFLIMVTDPNETKGTHESILGAFTNSAILIIMVSIIYVAPFILFLGLPAPIIIDKLVNNIKYQYLISLFLHILIGFLLQQAFGKHQPKYFLFQ